jgi:hypothetical protein
LKIGIQGFRLQSLNCALVPIPENPKKANMAKLIRGMTGDHDPASIHATATAQREAALANDSATPGE